MKKKFCVIAPSLKISDRTWLEDLASAKAHAGRLLSQHKETEALFVVEVVSVIARPVDKYNEINPADWPGHE